MKSYIVVHHSLTDDGNSVSWGAIEKYHKEVMGWNDIGYNFGVEYVDGNCYAMVGRDLSIEAAACKEAGMNHEGIHICCVGNFDITYPTDEMLLILVKRVIKPLMEIDNIPKERIIGHRDAGLMAGYDWTKGQYKSCPGKLFDLERVRGLV